MSTGYAEGRDGELVEALIAALAEGGDVSREWLYNATAPLALAFYFGEEFDRNHDPALNLSVLRRRLGEVLRVGVTEDFLVKAVRNGITEFFERFADTAEADKNRQEIRDKIDRALTDPAQFQDLKAYMPGASLLSDEEFRERLGSLANKISPTSADEAVGHWRNIELWTGLTEKHLPDKAFDSWSSQRVRKSRRQTN
ncbi:hypothetical protein [Micromonospora sp. NPDC049359]|uniref:hypothetical protein n=1 Tax=Micromonospora sp. NPDC049359 TaxID=3364270 RepID=UPI003794AF90